VASWRITSPVEAESLEEGAAVGLVTRFGSDFAVLRPFDGALDRHACAERMRGPMRLGELLVAEGMLTDDELAGVLAEQEWSEPKRPLGEILLRRKLIPGAVLVRFLSKQCERELEEEGGFGSGLRRAIEERHRAERATSLPVDELRAPDPPAASARRRRLGELLVESGLLTGAQLDEALAEQVDSGRLLGEILLDHGWVPTITLVNILSEQLHGHVELADGFGTGLRDAVEDRLLERLPEHEIAAA
jgi:hypothetical protein